jgi:hypothetical protein
MIAAGLGKITSGSDAELDAEMLQQDRHEIRNHDDHQQGVAESCAAREIRGPIAWIHVADRDKETGTGKCEQLSPKRSGHRDDDAAMHFRQRNVSGLSAPGSLACGQFRHFLNFLKILLASA